ncbi:MAG: bifunctional DNA primase/polymerase, partial [Bryobacteraceae bacterium]|nr:bifunctional DNA primase/polymerase [Bryobacteraceae bacterium]
MTPMAQAALDLVGRGFQVLPLKPGDKAPDGELVARGVKDASRDIDQVKNWFTRHPDDNVGVAPDHGMIVLDVDPRAGGHLSLAELELEHGELPETLWAWSGGTFHCE